MGRFGRGLKDLLKEPFIQWLGAIIAGLLLLFFVFGCSPEDNVLPEENSIEQLKEVTPDMKIDVAQLSTKAKPSNNIECVDYVLPDYYDLQLIKDHLNCDINATWGEIECARVSYLSRSKQLYFPWFSYWYFTDPNTGIFTDYRQVQYDFTITDIETGEIVETGCIRGVPYATFYNFDVKFKGRNSIDFRLDWTSDFLGNDVEPLFFTAVK